MWHLILKTPPNKQGILGSFDRNGLNYRDQFFLNKIAYEHQRRIPFTRVPFNDHDSIRYSDSVLLSTKFKAPRWLVNPIKIIHYVNIRKLVIFMIKMILKLNHMSYF